MKLNILIALVMFSVLAIAYPTMTPYVTDTAHLLSATEINNLNLQIATIEKNTSVEIAVLTLNSTNGEDSTLYANHIGEQNGVGKRATDNGIVILWSMNNEKGGAIATGRGIESVITDARVAEIGRTARPYFDNRSYYDGFAYIISEMNKTIVSQNTPQTTTNDPQVIMTSYWQIFPFLVLIGILCVAIPVFLGGSGSTKGRHHKEDDNDFGIGVLAGMSMFDDDHDSGSFSIPSSGGFSGGSFGGGSFGGGGGKF